MAKSWGIKNLYFYMVCLVTLFLFVGGAISAVNSAMRLALPDQPNIPLTQVYSRDFREPADQDTFDPPPLEELKEKRAAQEQQRINYSAYTKRSMLNSIALMIIAAPFYLLHWKQVKPELSKRGARNEN